mmetsp:Transcript_13823/g.29939  ORF Transcript_13823/g.29939 Transcript_13823/m.29939 type:complete len:405 (-) Transcript_13823:292-1506(-)
MLFTRPRDLGPHIEFRVVEQLGEIVPYAFAEGLFGVNQHHLRQTTLARFLTPIEVCAELGEKVALIPYFCAVGYDLVEKGGELSCRFLSLRLDKSVPLHGEGDGLRGLGGELLTKSLGELIAQQHYAEGYLGVESRMQTRPHGVGEGRLLLFLHRGVVSGCLCIVLRHHPIDQLPPRRQQPLHPGSGCFERGRDGFCSRFDERHRLLVEESKELGDLCATPELGEEFALGGKVEISFRLNGQPQLLCVVGESVGGNGLVVATLEHKLAVAFVGKRVVELVDNQLPVLKLVDVVGERDGTKLEEVPEHRRLMASGFDDFSPDTLEVEPKRVVQLVGRRAAITVAENEHQQRLLRHLHGPRRRVEQAQVDLEDSAEEWQVGGLESSHLLFPEVHHENVSEGQREQS